MSGRAPAKLAEIRAEIDRVDDEILRLLDERARLAAAAGAVKRAAGVPIHDPGREREIVERAKARTAGPLAAKAVGAIFEKIVEEARAMLLREGA
jgi:chorismate mutase/prephenate dehydratase